MEIKTNLRALRHWHRISIRALAVHAGLSMQYVSRAELGEISSTPRLEAQMASDQRSAALGTYFECRRFLSEDLGIDPSSHLVGLYRSIIETEDAF